MSLSSRLSFATPDEAATFDRGTVLLDAAGLVVFVTGLLGGFVVATTSFVASTDPFQSLVYPLILVAAGASFAFTGARIIMRTASRASALLFTFLLLGVGLLRLVNHGPLEFPLFMVFALAFVAILRSYQPALVSAPLATEA